MGVEFCRSRTVIVILDAFQVSARGPLFAKACDRSLVAALAPPKKEAGGTEVAVSPPSRRSCFPWDRWTNAVNAPRGSRYRDRPVNP